MRRRRPGAATAPPLRGGEQTQSPAGPRHSLPGAAIIATVVLAVLAAACSSASPSSTGSGGSAVGYSHCMRSHGVPNYPDPNSSGQLPKGDPQRIRGQHLPVPDRPASLPAPAPDRRVATTTRLPMYGEQRLPTGPGAADADRMRKLAGACAPTGCRTCPTPPTVVPVAPWFNISNVGISDAASHTHRFIAKLNECARLVGDNAPESFG